MAYHLDYETFSKADLKKFGAYRYACDPSTEILFCAIARDDADPLLWVNPLYETPEFHSEPGALELIREAAQSEEPIYAHNAQFEAAVSKYLFEKTFGLPAPRLEKWRCTAAMARRAAIPSSLEEAGAFLKLATEKDKRGKALIAKFSVIQNKGKRAGTRILPSEDPAGFREFGQYCKTDVVVEKGIHKALAAFELKADILEAFQFDMRMNDRGIPVNVPGLAVADVLVEEFEALRSAEFTRMTGLAPSQGARCLEWLKARGYPMDDLTAGSVDTVLTNGPAGYGMTQEAFDALKVRSEVGFAALKKIPTMLGAACPDGLVRGALLWSGAERTHRWAGRIIQPQNFRRPTVPDTERAYDLICKGADCESLEALFGPALETIASCIRHFIHGNGFWDADYSAIEARVNPWLCGQEDKLQDFRDKKPLYEMMGSRIFRVPISAIGPKSVERFVGKQAELGCGYNMGGDKFRATCANYGQEISQALADKAVAAWRAANPIIVESWKTIGIAAMNAIRNPGKIFEGTRNGRIRFGMTKAAGFPALVMLLPSGHKLIYPHAKIVRANKKFRGEEYEADEIQFWGKLPMSANWGWCSTYGGKLLENATQATAGDVMTHGALNAERHGYEIMMLVHDQALSLVKPGQTIEEFCKLLCTLPAWAEGLPIAAEGEFVRFYKK
jgi:DNA polymerase